MDKIASIKRKAQRFVQSGDGDKAVAEYERLIESGQAEPYDHVFLGDLLVKIEKLDGAVERYREAVAAYEKAGLYKNAIAVGKKILRIKPELFEVHRQVGSLYYLEGLFTDSLFYFMQYLSAAPPDAESPAIEDTGVKVLGMPLPSAEVALRVVDYMQAANCAPAAARPLLHLARSFEAGGADDCAARLKTRALALDPDAAISPGPEPGPGPAEPGYDPDTVFAPPIDPARFSRRDSGIRLRDTGDDGNVILGPDGMSMDFGTIRLPGEIEGDEQEPQGVADPAGPVGGPAGAGVEDLPAEPEPDEDEGLRDLDTDTLVRRAEEAFAAGDQAEALRCSQAAARKAFSAGESHRAETIYTRMVRQDPNHLGALLGLTEIAHINGERAKIVRYGCELGDVYLAREEYAKAKLEFDRVLQFDPKNEKARSRVARLNSIEGMEDVKAGPLAPVASEVMGATVSVRGEPSRTQSIMDLSEILTEFQNAMAGQIDADDAQSHYDLGMTYLEMEMADQAVAEFELAMKSRRHRGPAAEMMARCLLTAGRPEEALNVTEQVTTESEGLDSGRMAALVACRGRALEALGRVEEAIQALEMALTIDPGLDPAREALSRLRQPGNEAAA